MKTRRIEKGYYVGQEKGYTFFIIYNDDLSGELLWSIHFEDDQFGEKVFDENGEDQLWYSKKEALEMTTYFIQQYS